MLSLVGGELYQWDTGRVVKVVPDENVTVHEVHFSTKRMDYAYVLKTYVEDGVTYCAIPNIILQQSNRLLCYEVCQNSDGEETIADTYFDIIKRNRPEDYVYTEQEHFTIQNLSDRVTELEAWKDLNSSIVKYTDQSLTDEQKAQARVNIDAAEEILQDELTACLAEADILSLVIDTEGIVYTDELSNVLYYVG